MRILIPTGRRGSHDGGHTYRQVRDIVRTLDLGKYIKAIRLFDVERILGLPVLGLIPQKVRPLVEEGPDAVPPTTPKLR